MDEALELLREMVEQQRLTNALLSELLGDDDQPAGTLDDQTL